jgi:hypothetical protein
MDGSVVIIPVTLPARDLQKGRHLPSFKKWYNFQELTFMQFLSQ